MRTEFLTRLLVALLAFGVSCEKLYARSDLPADLSDAFFTEDELDRDELQELIDFYHDNPLTWENCRVSDLRALPLNDRIKNHLIELKISRKKITAWESLAIETELDAAEIEAIRYFIIISPPARKPGQVMSFISFKKQTGAAYLQKSLQRVRYYTQQGYFIGGVAENDHDEPRIWDYRNFSLRAPKLFGRLDFLGGAYRLQWGQGLLFSANLMSGRSTDITGNLNSPRPGFRNYIGTDENRYLFGPAVNLSCKNLNLSAFYSYHRLDATLDENHIVTNLRSDGLHINSSQIQAKDVLTETLVGLSLLHDCHFGSAGLLLFETNYNFRMNALGRRSQIAGLSLFHHHEINNWTVSGELAVLDNGSRAVTENIGIDLEKIFLSTGWRFFAPQFFAPLGSPFRKFGGFPSNESGLFAGLKIKLNGRWYCSGYVDFFRAIESYQEGKSPRKGLELLAGTSHQLKSSGVLETWYKAVRYYQTPDQDILTDRQIKFHLRRTYSRIFTAELRAIIRWNDTVRLGNGGQAFGLVGHFTISEALRLTVGTTQYYVSQTDLAIYFYESGLSSQFNLNNLTGTGQHYFVLISRRIGTACEIAGSVRWHSAGSILADLQLAFGL